MTVDYVLDAWALLAMLQAEEPAATRVRELLTDAERDQIKLAVSIINLGEVYYRVGRLTDGGTAEKTLEEIRRLPITIVPAADEWVWAAAELKRRHPISYADAFAAALAQDSGAALVTGDPELVALRDQIAIEPLGRTGKA